MKYIKLYQSYICILSILARNTHLSFLYDQVKCWCLSIRLVYSSDFWHGLHICAMDPRNWGTSSDSQARSGTRVRVCQLIIKHHQTRFHLILTGENTRLKWTHFGIAQSGLSHPGCQKTTLSHRTGDTSTVCLSKPNSSFVLEHTGTCGHCSLNHLLLRGEVAPESNSDICSIALATQKQINRTAFFSTDPVICLDGIFTRVADSDRSFLALEAFSWPRKQEMIRGNTATEMIGLQSGWLDPLDPLVMDYGSVTHILPPWRTEMPCLKNPCQK